MREDMNKPQVNCSDHSCVFGHPGGMGTNGGCRCLMDVRDPSVRREIKHKLHDLVEYIKELEEELDEYRRAQS